MEIRMRSIICTLILATASLAIGPTKSSVWPKLISGGEAFRRTHCR